MKNGKFLSTIVAFALTVTATVCADVAPPSKTLAKTILESMGFEQVAVAFIIQGTTTGHQAPTSSPNVAVIEAMGYFEGKLRRLQKQFYYDSDLGWFFTEDKTNKSGETIAIRIWSNSGYSEVAAPPRVVAAPPATRPQSAPTGPPLQNSQKAEAKLNEFYAEIREKLNDEGKAALKQEQLKWLREREKPGMTLSQQLELTEARVKELEQRLNK